MPRGGGKGRSRAAFSDPPELVDMSGQVFRENMRQRKQPRPANWAPRQASLNQTAPARAKRSALTFLIQLLVQLLSGATILAFVWFTRANFLHLGSVYIICVSKCSQFLYKNEKKNGSFLFCFYNCI